jgi:hypothetical protein
VSNRKALGQPAAECEEAVERGRDEGVAALRPLASARVAGRIGIKVALAASLLGMAAALVLGAAAA